MLASLVQGAGSELARAVAQKYEGSETANFAARDDQIGDSIFVEIANSSAAETSRRASRDGQRRLESPIAIAQQYRVASGQIQFVVLVEIGDRAATGAPIK